MITDIFEKSFREFLTSSYDQTDLLHEVMLYGALNPGKRVRAKLCLLSAQAIADGQEKIETLRACFALEMVHAYSLIHDDLPILDNDDMRRGLPSAHKKFDEPRALLAGDALLTDAMRILVDPAFSNLKSYSFEQQSLLVREFTRASGGHGMVRGQMLDIHWTDRAGYTQEILENIHAQKTGYLLGAACSMGCISGGNTNEKMIEKFRLFGIKIGLAFQIRDDFLDDKAAIGKTPGKDESQNKLTYKKFMNEEEAQNKVHQLTKDAKMLLSDVLSHLHSSELFAFAESLIHRTR